MRGRRRLLLQPGRVGLGHGGSSTAEAVRRAEGTVGSLVVAGLSGFHSGSGGGSGRGGLGLLRLGRSGEDGNGRRSAAETVRRLKSSERGKVVLLSAQLGRGLLHDGRRGRVGGREGGGGCGEGRAAEHRCGGGGSG